MPATESSAAKTSGKANIGLPPAEPKRRVDPLPRSIDGTPRGVRVKNRDPEMVYKLVGKDFLEQYIEDGYTVVERTPDGAVLGGGATVKVGQEQTYRGLTLMQVSKARHDDIEQHGPEGGRGQARADILERALLKPAGMNEHDPSRGRHGRRYMTKSGLEIDGRETRFEGVED